MYYLPLQLLLHAPLFGLLCFLFLLFFLLNGLLFFQNSLIV